MVLNPPDDTVITRHPLADAIAGADHARMRKGIVRGTRGAVRGVFRGRASGGAPRERDVGSLASSFEESDGAASLIRGAADVARTARPAGAYLSQGRRGATHRSETAAVVSVLIPRN